MSNHLGPYHRLAALASNPYLIYSRPVKVHSRIKSSGHKPKNNSLSGSGNKVTRYTVSDIDNPLPKHKINFSTKIAAIRKTNREVITRNLNGIYNLQKIHKSNRIQGYYTASSKFKNRIIVQTEKFIPLDVVETSLDLAHDTKIRKRIKVIIENIRNLENKISEFTETYKKIIACSGIEVVDYTQAAIKIQNWFRGLKIQKKNNIGR
jgi:hypothetical protein